MGYGLELYKNSKYSQFKYVKRLAEEGEVLKIYTGASY